MALCEAYIYNNCFYLRKYVIKRVMTNLRWYL